MTDEEMEAKSLIYGGTKVMLMRLSTGRVAVFNAYYQFQFIMSMTSDLEKIMHLVVQEEPPRTNLPTQSTILKINTDNIEL
jgi:hypothetical protein